MDNPVTKDVDLRFLGLPHFELASFMISMGDRMLSHESYREGVPAPVASGQQVKDVGTHYHGLATAALTGGPAQQAELEAYRPTAVMTAATVVTWAALRSTNENNPSLVTVLGVESRKQTPPSRNTSPVPLVAPNQVNVRHGNTTEVWVSFPKVKGALTYFVGLCTEEPGREESWTTEVHFSKCRDVIKGLTPGKIYYFRVRAFGHAGYGPWSPIVSLMVI